MRVIFATFAAVVLFALGYLYFYLGVYKDVDLKSEKYPDYFIYYVENVGPYHKIAKLITKIEKDFKKLGIDCEYTFGHFLDNPEIAPEDRLRSQAGCLFMIEQSKYPNHLKFNKVSGKEYLVARFSGAPSVGPVSVYPKAKDWFKKYNYKFPQDVTEIYAVNGDKVNTTYLFSLAPQ